MKLLARIGIVLGLAFAMNAQAAIDEYLRPKFPPVPDNNKVTSERVALGKALFFDPRLSSSGWISCASCHNPVMGWSDGLPTGFGHDMKRLKRATPTILNTAYNKFQTWDGRRDSLEAQALDPIEADGEMHQDIEQLVKKLSEVPPYVAMFNKAYPGEGITKSTIAKAIATFERTIVSSESPFDRWRRGSKSAISVSAKRGFSLFTGKAKCSNCHQGFNFTDDGFHNIGVKSAKGTKDLGRYAIRKVKILQGAFKTPTLRDITLTAPYMHNGMYKTLEEVVDHYDRGGDTSENLSPEMKPLNLTGTEKADLVAFLKTLTGKQKPFVLPVLP